MALLNPYDYYYFGRGEPEHRTNTGLHMVKRLDRDYDDGDYWLVDFFSHEGIMKMKDFIPEPILDRIRSGTVTLVMHNSHEAFHDIVEPIYQYIVTELNLPPKQILLLSESAAIRKPITEVAMRYNREHIRAEWIRIFEYNITVNKMMLDQPKKNFPTLQHKTYDKKFLNLNRRWRYHRSILVGLLEIFGLREKGYVSLANHTDGGDTWDSLLAMVPHVVKDNTIIDLFAANAEKIAAIPPLYLDTTELHINRAILTDSTNQYYADSYFSVVTETTFFKQFGEGVFLSEKIFKPVMMHHPFIVLSRPRTLEAIRSIGYKSFGEIIDESYDLEEDDDKRLLMIVREIERLSNLDGEDLLQFLDKAKTICHFNYTVLNRKTKWITTV